MGKIRDSIKTQPYLLSMSQIEVVDNKVNASNEKVISKVSKLLQNMECNLVLPIACLTETEDKYRLLTGVNIYEAAKVAGFKELWVFLISSQFVKSKPVIEQVVSLSKLNDIAIESTSVADFLVVLNNETISKLCSLKIGIGPKTAPKIVENRSYSTLNELQDKFGEKRVVAWLRTYKQKY
jgi:DNA uptake protein ComE-like DNA-binding protein